MMGNKFKHFAIISLFILSGITAFETYAQTYVEYFGKEKRTFTYTESKVDSDIKITLSCKERTEICILDSSYYCMKWIYTNNLNGTAFTAVRFSDLIQITGKKNGSEINCSLKIENQPWLQFWEFGISKMLSCEQSEMSFYSIDANKECKVATFLVKKKDTSTIKVGNQEEGASHIMVMIKGLPQMIFTANMWFRKDDNLFLKSEMPQGPFVPITRIEIQN